MAKPAKKQPEFDWYLREWLAALDIRFPQAWLVKTMDYSEGKASNLLTGKKRYDRDLINEISRALQIAPHELLMHPREAAALRQQRAAAWAITQEPLETPAPIIQKKSA
jgi:hypothetical protein